MSQGNIGTVLIVEDDDAIRCALRDALLDESINVVEATNGQEGLACLACVKPDYILLDLMMPAMSGLEFRQRQLANPQIAEVPVIVMTASSDVDGIASTHPLAIVRKPFVIETLLAHMLKLELVHPKRMLSLIS